ncbi:aspartate/glutamate racemase family protein [Paenibacillus sp. S150]|uniref:aspartate/glutamate racemase family protein n=1 Tax=Paenibacillus sp. S150 TaxID=2749826 RepID=UPI001C560897|nr:amino acid racemase [Paenibacillus sp. S150]MBW4083957.1 amino acid racemase [Paenibacillus sp. S150]
MKKIGIVGGIGPASTLDYYSGIINGFRQKTNDDNYPEIVINSINMTEMLSYVSCQDWDALVDLLLKSIKNLAKAGVELASIASNTPHIVPLISIVEETCKYAQLKKCKKVVVIGTQFTMSSGLYAKAFKKYAITAVVPSECEQTAIHNIIFPKLEEGIVLPEDRQKIEITERLLVEQSADGLVLGCTELPLIIKDKDLDTLILNTTQIHIEAIVNSIWQAL